MIRQHHIGLDRRFSLLPQNRILILSSSSTLTDVYDDLSDEEMYALFDKLLKEHVVKYNPGDKGFGTIVSMDKKNVYVDMGLKDFALLPRDEVSISGKRAEELLNVGDSRELLVLKPSEKGFQYIVSIKALEMEVAWERARQQLQVDAILDASVTEATKGGYRVEVLGLKPFLPVSQIHPQYLVDELIGKRIPIKLIDVDASNNRCVCSNRKAIAEDENAMATLSELKVGDVVSGYIQNVTTFGAFVDLNSLAGLLHVSQISNDRITTTDGIFHIGEPIKCMVLAVDKDKGRLSLTTKKLEPSPGDMLRNRAQVMDKAEDMAMLFRKRMAAAEAAVRASEAQNNATIEAKAREED